MAVGDAQLQRLLGVVRQAGRDEEAEAALRQLADRGTIERATVVQAVQELGIDAEKSDPVTS